MNYTLLQQQASRKITLFLTIFSLLTIQTALHAEQPRRSKVKMKVTKFTPDNAFGGIDAQGNYKKKDKTATIMYDTTKYTFNTIDEDPNPILNPNKLDLVHLGFFTDRTNRADMPVITHIFGNPTNKNAQKVAETIHAQTKEQEVPIEEANVVDDSIIIFQPAKDFSGYDLIGNYSVITHEATINDPSKQNKKSYAFEHVQEGLPISLTSDNVRPLKKPMLIGSYLSAPQCSNGTPKVCSHVRKVTELYGYLKA